MDDFVSISAIDQKMAEMRIKNLELLKRHQEIEEDRQSAVRLGAITTVVETLQDTRPMRGATKNRVRLTTNQQTSQDNQHERIHRPPIRRKFENDRNDVQPQRAQRVDYNRLKRERAQEVNNQKQNLNSINPELQEYAYSFHYQSETKNDADEPSHAKKLVIVNNKPDRIGSGRFSKQQRVQEQGQRKREERMRRSAVQNNGHTGGTNEFHLDVPQMPIWQNSPMHVQFVPTNLNNHHTGIDHLVDTMGDQMDQSAYIHNFVYSSAPQATPYNANGTVYFAHPPPPMAISPLASQPHFHQFHPRRAFDNSNRPPFHLSPFQSLTSDNQSEIAPTDFTPRFRHFKAPEHENRLSQQRPMSGDFERLHNSHHSSAARFQLRPQTFYDFSSQQQQSNSNNNSFRLSNNNRHQRNNNNNNNNNNTSLPLSAYMNTDDSPNQNENNHWGTTAYQKRRPVQQRTHHQDKHQFPLSSYDPRQYGFNDNNYQRRNDFNNRRNTNNSIHNDNKKTNDIDLIEEWWEDNNTELIGTNQPTSNNDFQTTTAIDDSGNSSLSTSMNLKETTIDDFVNPLSDVSTTDSNIIESLDKLQQQLILEEAVDERLASPNDDKSNKEPATYDTAHFMQWAKEKFREELAGRLTAQEIQQHDAATTDDDDDEDKQHQSTTNNVEKIDAFEKLTIDENLSKHTQSIVVE